MSSPIPCTFNNLYHLLDSLNLITTDLIPIIISYFPCQPKHVKYQCDPTTHTQVPHPILIGTFPRLSDNIPTRVTPLEPICFRFPERSKCYMELPSEWLQFGEENFSIGIIIRTRSLKLNSGVLSNRTVGSHGNFINLRYQHGSGVVFEVDQHSSGINYGRIATFDINDGLWHHIIATRNGCEISLYLDGKMVQTIRTTGITNLTSTTPVMLGNEPEPNGSKYNMGFHGDIACVLIYHRCLNDEEIRGWIPYRDLK